MPELKKHDYDRLYSQIKDYEDEVSTLRQLLKTLHFAVNVDNVLRAAVNILMQIIKYDSCLLLLWDPDTRTYRPHEKRHADELIEGTVRKQIDDGLFDWAIRENRPVFVPQADGTEGTSSVIVPLSRGNLRVGVISVLTNEECTQRHLELLSILGDEVAETISNLQLVSETARAKNNLSNIISNMVDGVMTVDQAGMVGMISERTERILGVDRAVCVGRPFAEAFQPPFSSAIGRLQERTLRTRVNVHLETDYRRKDENIPLRISASVLYDEMRDAAGVVYVIMDISETRELNELRRLDELKASFLNNVSHELKTPLTSMKWAVDLLAEKIERESGDKDSLKLLGIIDNDNERLIELVTDLLDYSRIEAGKIVLDLQRADLPSMIEESMTRINMIAEKQGVTLRREMHGAVPALMLDHEKIRQVINNLLSNAIKFSETGGDVLASITYMPPKGREGTDCVLLQVRDRGIGIPENELTSIFDKFHRVSDQRVRNIQGTGLGLSICKSIVELHDGRIWAENNPEGGGTTITVMLPSSVPKG